jgi:hypothetical protein
MLELERFKSRFAINPKGIPTLRIRVLGGFLFCKNKEASTDRSLFVKRTPDY